MKLSELEFCCKKDFYLCIQWNYFFLCQCSGMCFSRNFISSQTFQFVCISFVKFFSDLFKVCMTWSNVPFSFLELIMLSRSLSFFEQSVSPGDIFIIIIKDLNFSMRFHSIAFIFYIPLIVFFFIYFYCFSVSLRWILRDYWFSSSSFFFFSVLIYVF